jgi:aspartyl-tRNA(Asn)/glutamyl-tRNA(Gln) amidotransferase subunit C
MSIDKATVAKIARLARIHVPDENREALAGEMSKILGWVEQLSEVNTDDVAPMTSVVEVSLPRREDAVFRRAQGDRVMPRLVS